MLFGQPKQFIGGAFGRSGLAANNLSLTNKPQRERQRRRMLQAPRQIKRIAFQLYAPQWISQKPLHDRVDRQGTDSRIVAEIQEAVAGMASFVIEINSSLGMRLRIVERPAKPADRPGAVMGLQQDVRILKSVRNVEQFFGNLFRARKLTASDVKQPQPGGALDDILPDASGTSLLPATRSIMAATSCSPSWFRVSAVT